MMRRSLSTDALPKHAMGSPDFFYTNAVYDRAYKSISGALRTRKGLVLLVGEAGTGKTKLMRLLSKTLEEQIRIYPCACPLTSFSEVLATFDELLTRGQRESRLPDKLQMIADRLRMWAYRGGTSVLVIDDAHTLDIAVLDQLPLLLDITHTNGAPLQVVLVGRPALETTLATPELGLLHERIALRAYLTPLPVDEIRTFIHQRYRSPSGIRQYLFTAEAIERIEHHSCAIPARINSLCESALMAAYVQGQKVVVPEMIETLAEKLFSTSDLQPSPPLPTPTPILSLEPELAIDNFLPTSDLHHVRHHLVRSGRALMTIGICAMLLLAGVTVAKKIRLEQLVATVPLLVTRSKQAFSAFFPQNLMANPMVTQPNRDQQPVPQKLPKTP